MDTPTSDVMWLVRLITLTPGGIICPLPDQSLIKGRGLSREGLGFTLMWARMPSSGQYDDDMEKLKA